MYIQTKKNCSIPFYNIGKSFNQPTFCLNSSWNPNATTVANITTIGSSPYDIFININNTIYVPNQDNGQIIVWSEGNLTSTRNISGNLLNSSSLFVTTTGDIYVDSFHTIGGITQITLNLTIHIPTMNICQQCWDIFIDINNMLYCSLSERHQIITKSLENDFNLLKIVGGTGTAGSTSNTLNNPRGIFVDTTWNLYVADCGNNRIQLFSLGKLSATTIVGNGSLNIRITLNCPTSIILDGNNYLFIVDSGNHRIVGSDASGFRCIIGCSGPSGSASYQLNHPWAISFDSSGNIFVSDQGNNRIQKFTLIDSFGKYTKTFYKCRPIKQSIPSILFSVLITDILSARNLDSVHS